MKRLSFPFRIGLYSFLISLACLLGIIYTEDFLIFEKIYLETNYQPNPEVYFGRVMLALGLSLVCGVVIYIFATVFVVKIIEFRKLILETARNYLPEYDLSLDSGFEETEQLKEVFRNSIYALQSKFSANITNVVYENNQNLTNQILPFTHKLQKPKIQGLDVAIHPLENYNPSSDYIDYISTKNGIICIMAGFSENSPLQAAFKARIQSIFSFAKEFYFYTEEDLLTHIQTSIRLHKIKGLNLTLFFVSTHKPQVKFLHFQKNPLFLIKQNELFEIPSIGETEYPFIEENSDLRFHNLEKEEFLVCITDRILDKPYFTKDILTSYWKKNMQQTRSHFSSSNEVAYHLTEFLDSKIHEKGTKEKLNDFLSYIIIRCT